MVTITESAQTYLASLLAKQEKEGVAVRMFVAQPGTRQAETCLAYCQPEEIKEEDSKLEFDDLTVYLDHPSLDYLVDAEVDYDENRLGGQLTIKAPNAKVPRLSPDASLKERINYILATDINPNLAAHGGEVSLIELREDNVAVLRFGGGCQGCSAVGLTLKEGVEKTLREYLPDLEGILDVTDHSVTENAYYQ